jgi:hypothetical protein
MKIIKGNFPDKKKGAGISDRKPEQQGNKTAPHDEAKYSALLLDLIKPYLEPRPHPDDLENMLELGIVAWNMAISKSMEFPDFQKMFDGALETAGIIETAIDTVKDIMKLKQEKYPDYTNFIENYEMIEDENGLIHVTIVSKSFIDFMNDIKLENEELEERQYEEGFVNRNALLVRPKPAFWNWVKQTDKDFTAPELPIEYCVYLINETASSREATKWVKKNFDRIFINELDAWITDENYWPKNRTYKMFSDLFEVEFHNMVMDLEKEPILKD